MDVLDKLLFDVETIGAIKRGEKINTSGEFINVEESGSLQGVWRTFNRESREKSVTVICQRIELLILVCDLSLDSKWLIKSSNDMFDIEYEKCILNIKRMHIALNESCSGINALIDTYSHDSNVVAKLKPLVGKIGNQVSKITHFLMEVGEYTDPKTNKLYINIMK